MVVWPASSTLACCCFIWFRHREIRHHGGLANPLELGPVLSKGICRFCFWANSPAVVVLSNKTQTGTDKFAGTSLYLSSNHTDLLLFWILSLLPCLDCPVGALVELLVGVKDTTPKFLRLNWTT